MQLKIHILRSVINTSGAMGEDAPELGVGNSLS